MIKQTLKLGSMTALSQGVTLFGTAIVSNLYTPSEFNSVNLISILVSVILPFTTLRLESFLAVSTKLDFQKQILFLQSWITFSCLVTWLISLALIATFTNASILLIIGTSTLISSLALIMSLSLVFVQISLRSVNFNDIGYSSLVQTFITFLFQLVFGIIKLSEVGLFMAMFLGRSLGLMPIRPHGEFSSLDLNLDRKFFTSFQKYFSMSKFLILGSFLEMTCFAFPVIFVTMEYGSKAGGIFGLSQTILLATVSLFGGTFGNVYMSLFAFRERENIESQKIHSYRVSLVRIFLLALFPLVFFSYVFPLIVDKYFGSQWIEVSKVLDLLTFPIFFLIILMPISNLIFLSQEWVKYATYNGAKLLGTVIFSFICIGLNLSWIGVIYWGYVGGVVSQIAFILRNRYLYRRLQV